MTLSYPNRDLHSTESSDRAQDVGYRAFDEIGAAVAHQINEPLTALLIYLQEIERAGERAAPSASMWDLIRKATREAERACNMLEEMRGNRGGVSVDVPTAIAHARGAIDAWAQARGSERRTHHERLYRSHPLTRREREVLEQIAAGASNKEGSRRLGISTRTFEVHRAHIMQKLGTKNAADLVRTALKDIL